MGGLNKTKILGAEDEESKSKDNTDEASLVLAKRLNVDWNNVKEGKKRCVNSHTHNRCHQRKLKIGRRRCMITNPAKGAQRVKEKGHRSKLHRRNNRSVLEVENLNRGE